MMLFGLVLGVAMCSILAPWLHSALKKQAGLLLGAVLLGMFAWFASKIPAVYQGKLVEEASAWVPSLGVDLAFRLDGLSLLFALLIIGIGGLILIYATGYLGKHKDFGRFLCLMLFFAMSMLGLVLADNLILLFIFWELTSISSYLLIGFNHEEKESRRNALQALLVTGFGGVLMMAGLILLGMAAGTMRLSEILASPIDFTSHEHYPWILTFVLLGAFTKSAQFPFHFWLPNAMSAPTPVSAYLHSATMVKAGLYLLLRLHPALSGTNAWAVSLLVAGCVTMFLAAATGLFKTDLKKILAYTTLSVLGVVTMLIGVGTEIAIKTALVFLVGHALYKACLFMCAGSIDHEAHTRDVTILGDLRKLMPITAVAAGLAALSKAGFPFSFGFIGKELVYKTGLAAPIAEFVPVLMVVAVGTNMMLLALAFKVGIHPFWDTRRDKSKLDLSHTHEAPWTMWLGPIILAGLGIFFGILPAMIQPLIAPASQAAFGAPVEAKLMIWHGFNLPLLLSGITLAGGITLYMNRRILWRKKSFSLGKWTADSIYDNLLEGIMWFAKWQTRMLQNGYLRNYLLVILGSTGLLLAWQLAVSSTLFIAPEFTPPGPLEMMVIPLMMVATVTAVLSNSRLTALISLGFVGFGIALLFALMSAPDLAITQVLVETLIVVLFMFVVYKLPKFRQFSSRPVMIFDALFAGIIGLLMTLLVLKAKALQLAPPLSERYAEWSYLLAKGKNVVNVILVDFRALDTLGEITVLTIAALGIYALMSRITAGREEKTSSTASKPESPENNLSENS